MRAKVDEYHPDMGEVGLGSESICYELKLRASISISGTGFFGAAWRGQAANEIKTEKWSSVAR